MEQIVPKTDGRWMGRFDGDLLGWKSIRAGDVRRGGEGGGEGMRKADEEVNEDEAEGEGSEGGGGAQYRKRKSTEKHEVE